MQFEKLTNWILQEGISASDLPQFFLDFNLKVREYGISLARTWYSMISPNPLIWGIDWTWEKSRNEIKTNFVPHAVSLNLMQNQNFPVFSLLEGSSYFRARLDTEELEYKLLMDLRDKGYTDYYALPFANIDKVRQIISYCSERQNGFTDAEIVMLNKIHPLFSLVMAFHDSGKITETLLSTYLGKDASERVINGSFKRGDGDITKAAIIFTDIRSFTSLSEKLKSEAVLDMLNDAFDVQVNSIEALGGHVLKFIGDGMLAVFHTENSGPNDACASALQAALDIQEKIRVKSIERVNFGKPEIKLGVALHFGEVVYGNIGAKHRLDFTVIGPAVNLTARLESCGSKSSYNIVMSEKFAKLCGSSVTKIGSDLAKGIGNLEIWTVEDR